MVFGAERSRVRPLIIYLEPNSMIAATVADHLLIAPLEQKGADFRGA